MTKRRIRFNFIDLLLLLLAAAVVFVLLYVFVLSDRTAPQEGEKAKTPIQYVVEIQNVDERFAESIKKGQPVQDAIKRKSVGTVDGAEAVPFEKIVFDYDNGEEVLAAAEGRITLVVTINVDADETDSAFSADGIEIRVGEQYSLMFPDLYGVGYCTALKINED